LARKTTLSGAQPDADRNANSSGRKMKMAAEATRKLVEEFWPRQAKGACTLPGGLHYQNLDRRARDPACSERRCFLHYRGTLLDARTSIVRTRAGSRCRFRSKGASGWTELSSSCPWSKWQLFIPPIWRMADRGVGPTSVSVPAQPLIFESRTALDARQGQIEAVPK